MSQEQPPVPFPWRSVAALFLIVSLLVGGVFGTARPGPSLAAQRDTRLWEAVRARDAAGAARALATGASPQRDMLAPAAAGDDLPTMTVLLAHGADINAPGRATDGRGDNGQPGRQQPLYAVPWLSLYETTPLMEAVLHDNLAATRFLLGRGASVDARNDADATALILAAGSARPQVAASLLEHGADADARTSDGWTALMSAAAMGRTETAGLLLARGANINAQNRDGDTPLAVAIAWGQTDAATFLREHKARLSLLSPPAAVGSSFSRSVPEAAFMPPHLAPPPNYAAFAAPLVGTEGESRRGPLWVTGTQWLGMRFGPRRLVLTDARTGVQTPLPGLTAFWNQPGHNIAFSALRVSPDGKWLLGPSLTAWVAVSLSGLRSHCWPCRPDERIDPVAWLPDSRHWAELDVLGAPTVHVRSLDQSQATSFPLSVRSRLSLLSLENDFTFATKREGRTMEIAPGPFLPAGFADTRSTDSRSHFRRFRPVVTVEHLVSGRRVWVCNTTALTAVLPVGSGNITECLCSPHGNRLAWRAAGLRMSASFYISRPNGRSLRRIFVSPAGLPDTPHGLRWTPDGRHLSFWWGHRAYWVSTKLGSAAPLA